MKHLSVKLTTVDKLREFISEHQLASGKGVIQLFSGASFELTRLVQQELKDLLKHYTLIGASTAGEIQDGACHEHAIVVSFMLFEAGTWATPFHLPLSKSGNDNTLLANQFAQPPVVIIFFANALDISPESLLKEGAAWVNRMRHLMKTWSSGGAYLNYTDALLKNWQQAYYGDHYARLQQIKTRYDKAQLFRFAQGIKPA